MTAIALFSGTGESAPQGPLKDNSVWTYRGQSEPKTHHWQLKATNLHTMTHKNRILRQTLKSGSTEDEKDHEEAICAG